MNNGMLFNKSFRNTCCVYIIECRPTGIIYVGSTYSIKKRWSEHQRQLKRSKHGNKYLQRAWDKYGPEMFDCYIVELTPEHIRLDREQWWITTSRCTDPEVGFNILSNARSPKGRKYPPEYGRRISARLKGRVMPPEQKLRLAQAMAEMRANRTESTKRPPITPETREKLIRSRQGKKPALGMVFSVEARRKIGDAHRGKTLSEAHRAKISSSNKGRKISKEHRWKVSQKQRFFHEEQLEEIRVLLSRKISMYAIAAHYGCSVTTIFNIRHKRRQVYA